MTRHDDKVRLKHMLEHAREAVAMIKGKERADLRRERMLELSLIRLIEVVGEAAARVSLEGRAKYTSIPWPHHRWPECAIALSTVTIRSIWTFCGIQSKMICHPS